MGGDETERLGGSGERTVADDAGAAPAPVGEPAVTIEPGTEVDHFEVVRRVGRGGMGEVYLARDTRLGRKVALKVIRPRTLGDERAVERFLFEARVTARFSHPHIVAIHFVGEVDGNPYVALEYLDGQTLRERLREGRAGTREALRIGLAVAEALEEAHRREVLHRDLKPENVFLPRDGRLRVVDFGLAKAARRAELAQTARQTLATLDESQTALLDEFETSGGAVVGTPAYMAPEQWTEDELSPATDVWALGLMLYELLAGRRPYRGGSAVALCAAVCSPEPVPQMAAADDVPREIVELVARCLEKQASRRPTAAEVARVLRRHLHRERPGAAAESPFRGLLPFTERHADWFLGREAEVAAFVERLRGEPVLPVVGPSGAGKSSFVQAGVVPRLREQGRWTVLRLRPGGDPFHALAVRLGRGDEGSTRSAGSTGAETVSEPVLDSARARELEEQLTASPRFLAYALQQVATREAGRVLLFVDQLEELYTLVDDAVVRDEFMRAVCGAADDPDGPVRVVFTLRDDFLIRLSETEEARVAFGRLTVLRSPDEQALREILTVPLQRVDHRFEDDALVDEMLAAVRGEAACLPLIQFTCAELWRRRDRDGRVLTRSAYESLGGVEGALAHHADGVIEELTPDQVRLARELLLRLVTPERTRRVLTRVHALEGLGEAAGEVLDRLVSERVLQSRRARKRERAEAEVELVHESLVGNWARLAGWIEESREELVFLAEVGQAAELWAQRGRSETEVWEGDALRDAVRRTRGLDAVPGTIRSFLDAGLARERRELRRRRWLLAAGFAALAVVAVLLAVLWTRAESARERSDASRADLLLEGAAAALERGDVLAARSQVRSSLELQDSTRGRALWWALREEPLEWSVPVHNHEYGWMDWSADGTRLVAPATPPLEIDVRTAETRDLLDITGPTATFSVGLSPDGTRLLRSLRFSDLEVWELPSRTRLAVLLTEGADVAPRSNHSTFRFDPRGRWFVLAVVAPTEGYPDSVRVFDSDTLEERFRVPGVASRAYALSDDGDELVVARVGGGIEIWDIEKAEPVQVVETGPERIRDLAISPDEDQIISFGLRDGIRVWDRATGRQLAALDPYAGVVGRPFYQAVDFQHRDGWLAAVAVDNHTIRLWDVTAGEILRELDVPQSSIDLISFSPDGQLLACKNIERVSLFDLRRGADLASGAGHKHIAKSVAMTADGSRVVSGGHRGQLWVWDAATAEPLGVLEGHEGGIFSVATHPHRLQAATGGLDGTVRLWDLESGTALHTLRGHKGLVYSVDYGPDGTTVASGSFDGTVRLWDVASGALQMELEGGDVQVRRVRFRPDGGQLASAGDSGAIHLWDLPSGTLARTLPARATNPVHCLSYGADGALLASTDMQGLTLVWDLASGASREVVPEGGDVALEVPERFQFRTVAFHPTRPWLGTTMAPSLAGAVDLESLRQVQVEYEVIDPIGREWRYSRDGRWVALAEAGTVRVLDAETGAKRWDARVLWPDPPALKTHRGWEYLDPARAGDPQGVLDWVDGLLAEPGAGLIASPSGDALCRLVDSTELERWDVPSRTRQWSVPIADALDAFPLEDACVAVVFREDASGADLGLLLHHGEGEPVEIHVERGFGLDEAHRRLLHHGADRIELYDEAGALLKTVPIEENTHVVAVLEDGRLVVSRWDGLVEIHPPEGGGERATMQLADFDSLDWPIDILGGPRDTLVALFRPGHIAIWDLTDGRRLRTWKLHGRPDFLHQEGDTLYVGTSVGDSHRIDLSLLAADYCDLMDQVWADAPRVWDDGQAVVAPSPARHPCRPSP